MHTIYTRVKVAGTVIMYRFIISPVLVITFWGRLAMYFDHGVHRYIPIKIGPCDRYKMELSEIPLFPWPKISMGFTPYKSMFFFGPYLQQVFRPTASTKVASRLGGSFLHRMGNLDRSFEEWAPTWPK